ncbi:enoyl-CoA hydratase [Noviherbaspirillum sp. Root189]|uniref:enoyl-CoA hydratase n=1 Tax=Noviherbaspirillum sp. Root189 TaxID=1736487 RepID=UPI00070D6265|nr:enoyl-CoA hydratase [Noviherbaspirillum sp. Root189]KRB86984.1 enoyl-CoA hydratase [Noviherbaspirillum sp. Root189]
MAEQLAIRHAVVTMDKGIATLTISDAGSLNILSTPVIKDVIAQLKILRTDSSIRTLVLRGTGDKGLIGGADIKEMAALNRQTGEEFISNLREMCDGLRQFPAPVIARMPGWTLGGGLEVAMACDLRIASQGAKFGMPEVKVGIPSVIHASLIPRLIGGARAAWLLLTGETVDSATALAWGLVHEVVPDDELDSAVSRVASSLAGMGPEVLRQQKRLLREWEDQGLDASIVASVREFGAAFETGEPQRYMQEFLDKKAARHSS